MLVSSFHAACQDSSKVLASYVTQEMSLLDLPQGHLTALVWEALWSNLLLQ